MSDLIKREDAIKAMEQRYEDILRTFKRKVKIGEKAIVLDMIGCVKNLPSAGRPQEWIPCSERLPDLNENGVSDMVLLCWSDGQMTVGAYQGDRTFVGQAWPTARDCRVTVTAWQSLPKPWKGADDE